MRSNLRAAARTFGSVPNDPAPVAVAKNPERGLGQAAHYFPIHPGRLLFFGSSRKPSTFFRSSKRLGKS